MYVICYFASQRLISQLAIANDSVIQVFDLRKEQQLAKETGTSEGSPVFETVSLLFPKINQLIMAGREREMRENRFE